MEKVTIPAGTLIHWNGLPFRVTEDAAAERQSVRPDRIGRAERAALVGGFAASLRASGLVEQLPEPAGA